MIIITFYIDQDIYDYLEQWSEENPEFLYDYYFDMQPLYKNIKILFNTDERKWLQVRYNINLDCLVYAYVAYQDRAPVILTIERSNKRNTLFFMENKYDPNDMDDHTDICSAYILLNTFLLYSEKSFAAKKALRKRSVFDFKNDTFFTVRISDDTAYIDTCEISKYDDRFRYVK